MAPSYGTSVDYGPTIIGGGYGNTTFVNNIPHYGTSIRSSNGGAPISYGSLVSFGAVNARNGGLYNNDSKPTLGSIPWGVEVMAYGNRGSFVGYERPRSGGISHY